MKMAASDEQAFRRDQIEDASPVLGSQRIVDVVFAGHLRTRDLNFGHMNGIAPNNERLADRVQTTAGMSPACDQAAPTASIQEQSCLHGWGEADRDRHQAW